MHRHRTVAMDFESLIGSSAYLAKQLELRWFYHWEDAACDASAALSPTAHSEISEEATRSSGPDADDVPAHGRLVRKRCRSMPFLRRNFTGRRSRGADRRDVCRFPTAAVGSATQSSGSGKGGAAQNPKPKGVAAATSRKRGAPAKEADVSSHKEDKRKKARGESQDCRDTKGRAHGEDTQPTTAMTTLSHLPFNQSRSSSELFSSSPEFQSYARSPTVRRTILESLPVELHHDDAFVLERTKAAWLQREARDGGQGRLPRSESGKGTGEGDAVCGDAAEGRGHTQNPVKITAWGSSTQHLNQGNGIKEHVVLPSHTILPWMARDTRRRFATLQHARPLPPAYFHYAYMQPNNIPATFVEELDGRTCPLCHFDGQSNDDLLAHCVSCHGMSEGKDFEAALGEEGQLHVLVRGLPTGSSDASSPRTREDFVFVRSRSPADGSRAPTPLRCPVAVSFLRRDPRKVAALDAAARHRKLRALRARDAPASALAPYLPRDAVPRRQYFHSRTNLPMACGEWAEDSDDETDSAWRHDMGAALLDEIEDVSVKEKAFMKMWNRFLQCDHVVADRDVPGKCREFVVGRRAELRHGGLRLNLLLHLCNLWDSGVVSSNRILSCMMLYDAA